MARPKLELEWTNKWKNKKNESKIRTTTFMINIDDGEWLGAVTYLFTINVFTLGFQTNKMKMRNPCIVLQMSGR